MGIVILSFEKYRNFYGGFEYSNYRPRMGAFHHGAETGREGRAVCFGFWAAVVFVGL